MTNFGLINMNGRLYDPYLQRFLSPDNVVQSPGNAQNYNRYSYCMNNPLMYVDPTGWNMYYPNGYDGGIVGGGGGAGSMEDDPYWVCSGDGVSFGGGSTLFSGYLNSAGRCGYSYIGDGTYVDNFTGDEVSFDKVQENYITPNALKLNPSSARSFAETLIEFVKAGFQVDVQIATNGHLNVLTSQGNGWGLTNGGDFSNSDIRLAIAEVAVQEGGFNIDNAVSTLNANANERSVHACGRYVGLALQAGGIKGAMADGKDYGPILLKNGFNIISKTGYSPIKGDVTVYDGNATHKWGHVQIYNGNEWVSDFFQGYIGVKTGYEYGGNGFMVYSKDIPPITIYRIEN